MRFSLSFLALMILVGCGSAKLTKDDLTYKEDVTYSSNKHEAFVKTSAYIKKTMINIDEPVKQADEKTGLLFAEYVDSCKGKEHEDGSYFYDVEIKFEEAKANVAVTMKDLRDEEGYKAEMSPGDKSDYVECSKNAAKKITREIAGSAE